ncbi:MAG: iron-sulfur cluster assembly accessory protein [Myxococcales bacterium]|nr:iron-sulfur cluster assembly accessory protein [Myxococcales bacterium]
MVCETPKNPPDANSGTPSPKSIEWVEPSAPTICLSGPGEGKPTELGRSGITIADSAHARLGRLLAERPSREAGLRIAVQGGGCSGLAYKLSWDEASRDKDRVFERDGVRVFVDPKSYLFLVGALIEYREELLQAGFKITNPKARATCGCGESFSI